ncbi:unnamed protein product [Bemisia tabaci]|uniref:Ionotropic receptor n=1 Tax=Bemisia tabaci TaxID=7038 RepID=A0A9P0A2T0_BEMTA|nr:unnamed protein product [Bemisia tabaci]
MVANYFSSPGVERETVILITCSFNDELLWQRHLFDIDHPFYTGRGGLNEKCELSREALTFTYRRLGVYVDYDCECAKHAISQLSTLRFFIVYIIDRQIYACNSDALDGRNVGGYNFTTSSISWLFWSTKLNETNLNSLPINLRLYSEAKFALGDTEGMKLFDIYRIHEGMPIESVLAASWDTAVGLVWHLQEDTYRRRINFRDIVLQGGLAVVDYNLSDPNLFETLRNHNQDKSKETIARVFYTAWDLVQEIHNFSLNITVIPNVGYTKKIDGNYDGLIGLLQTGRIDFAISGLGMLDFRIGIIDYNNLPIWNFRSCFFFLQPRFLERSTLLVYPFRGIVWLTSFLVMLMSLIFVSVVAVFDKSMRMSIGSALLYFSAIFSQQGAVLTSQWVSGRLVLLISLIFGYILLNYYSGQIVSEVLSRSPSTINTFSQLLSSPLLLAADKVPPYLKVRYKTQRSHHIPEIGVKVEKTGGYLNVEEGMEVVRGSLYAFETEASRGYYLIDKTYTQAEICSVGEISMPTVESFIALKYQSPFKQPISTTVMVLNERGLLKRLNNLWRYPKPQCSGTTNLVPVDLENASIAFYILLSGAIIGCATFLVENYVSNSLHGASMTSEAESKTSERAGAGAGRGDATRDEISARTGVESCGPSSLPAK